MKFGINTTNRLLIVTMLAPAIVLIFLFILFPIIRLIFLSFTDTHLMRANSGNFIGLKNVSYILRDIYFWQSLKVTIIYTFSTVIGS